MRHTLRICIKIQMNVLMYIQILIFLHFFSQILYSSKLAIQGDNAIQINT